MDPASKVEMLERYRAGESVKSLSAEYGISRKTFYVYRSQLEHFLRSGDVGQLGDGRSRPRREELYPELEAALVSYTVWQPRKGATEILRDLRAKNPHAPWTSHLSVSIIQRFMRELGYSTYGTRSRVATIYQKAARLCSFMTLPVDQRAQFHDSGSEFVLTEPDEAAALSSFAYQWWSAMQQQKAKALALDIDRRLKRGRPDDNPILLLEEPSILMPRPIETVGDSKGSLGHITIEDYRVDDPDLHRGGAPVSLVCSPEEFLMSIDAVNRLRIERT